MKGGLLLNRTRQAPAEDSAAFAGVAERFRRAGDLDRAITLCREGLAKFPKLLSARVTLGWALLDKGQYDEARAELEQVLRRAPDNLAAIRGLAELHDRTEHMSTIDAAADISLETGAPQESPAGVETAEEPISLAHLDFSTPIDAPIQIETAARTTIDPSGLDKVTSGSVAVPPSSAAAVEPAAVTGSAAAAPVTTVSVQTPAVEQFHVDVADPLPASGPDVDPYAHAPAAASGWAADEPGTALTASDDIDLSALELDSPGRPPEAEPVLTLPDSGEISFEALASAFESDVAPETNGPEPAFALDTGTDTLIAELRTSGFAAPSESSLDEPAVAELQVAPEPTSPEHTERVESDQPDLAAADSPVELPQIDEPWVQTLNLEVEGAPSATDPVAAETPDAQLLQFEAFSAESLLADEVPSESATIVTEVAPALEVADLDRSWSQAAVAEAVGEEAAVDEPAGDDLVTLDLSPIDSADLDAARAALAIDGTTVVERNGGATPADEGARLADVPSSFNLELESHLAPPVVLRDVSQFPDRHKLALGALDRFGRQARARRLEVDARSVA